ncbi:unnamed protein product [Cylindrotheca closterium]|uniref:Tudor domain-containing protein n=1 Tax=Cylindrotheca closterium TaxID=2856 RepID=A0AAD2CBP6_9STRA|nr:unnamed protein product [Cylindrotheca closterium]
MSSCGGGTTNTILEIGTRISCFWPDDEQWYKGTVAKQLDGDRFWIKYDDGDEEEINIKKDKWKTSNHPEEEEIKANDGRMERSKQARIDKLELGSRIAVYFPHEEEYYAGTITEIKVTPKCSSPHRINYDDGDEELTDLRQRKFKLITKKSGLLKVGSRVAICNRIRKKNDHATVVKIEPERAKPHKVKYDKEGRGEEWLNLHVHSFLNMPVEWDEKKRKEELEDLERPCKTCRRQAQLQSNKEAEAVVCQENKKGHRKIDQLCLKTGRVIATFDTISAAAKAVGVSKNRRISNCCNDRGFNKTAGGFGWRFSKEERT